MLESFGFFSSTAAARSRRESIGFLLGVRRDGRNHEVGRNHHQGQVNADRDGQALAAQSTPEIRPFALRDRRVYDNLLPDHERVDVIGRIWGRRRWYVFVHRLAG